jgi:hypothetical protein
VTLYKDGNVIVRLSTPFQQGNCAKVVQDPISKQGCFNCVHNNQKLGHCDLMGEHYGIKYAKVVKYALHSERSMKLGGSTCKSWKEGKDLFEKWQTEKYKEKVKFT